MESVFAKPMVQEYPAYKDTGEFWLNEIPEHWDLMKLKHVFVEKRKQLNPNLPCGAISYGTVVFKDDEKVTEATKASYQEVRKGDFLINPLNLNYDLKSLRIALSDIDVVVSSGYLVLQDRIELNRNYFRWLLHLYDVAYMKIFGSGVRQTISFNHIADSLVLYPPLPEQTRIAAFLDRKCGQIDQAIAQKERLIALLKERRQVLVQQAVTKGLNPKAKMKDSGVAWLGEVPEHWEVRRLKYLVDKRISNIDKHSVDRQEPVRLCNYVDVYKNDHIHDGIEFMRATATQEQINRFRLRKGDVIITKDSEEWLDIAVPSLVTYEADDLVCGYHLALLRPLGSIYGPYLHRGLEVKPIKLQFSLEANGVTRVGLSHSSIGNPLIPVPPMEEQIAISGYIENALISYNEAEERMRTTIAKLKEYRSILINAAVTGKIKVPEE